MDYGTIQKIVTEFKNIKVDIIGRSEDDRDIYSLSAFFDATRQWVLMHGGIHAREHLSVDFVVCLAKMIENNFNKYLHLKSFPNICFVPMVNPDGIEIAFSGAKNIKNIHLKSKVTQIIANNNYKMYKSNANGVDLNNNFDAGWGFHIYSPKPSMSGYIGVHPFSEKETKALRDLTLQVKPVFTISYHMKGEEIYWDFFQRGDNRKKHEKIAKIVSKINQYAIKSTEKTSSGGYKDWCVQTLNIPSLTIELGRDKFDHPVPTEEIYDIISKNVGILDKLCDILEVVKGN